jgi:hypothetical protein
MDGAAGMHTRLVNLRHSLAAEARGEYRRNQGNKSNPQISSSRGGHLVLQEKTAQGYWPDHIGDFGPPW